jgi:hypothetical protein
MTQAVCFKCGEIKWGAFDCCAQCQSKPKTDDELMYSLAFTDHYFQEDALRQIGRSIKSGCMPPLTDALMVKLTPAVREAKAILGIALTAKKTLVRRQRFKHVLVILLMNGFAVIVVGSILDLIPWSIRRPLGYIAIPVAAVWLLWSWSRWRAKERGDQNELDVLEETVQEHEQGRRDYSDYIKKQMFFIERDHTLTPNVQQLLERARRAIQG